MERHLCIGTNPVRGDFMLYIGPRTIYVDPEDLIGCFYTVDAAAEYAHVEFEGRVVEYPQDV